MNARGTLARGETALLDDDGAALMIHADPDDLRDVESGGDRIACAVVTAGG